MHPNQRVARIASGIGFTPRRRAISSELFILLNRALGTLMKLVKNRICAALAAIALGIGLNGYSAAQGFSGKLFATGGVSQVEGAGGGGLAPWALITGYGTENQIGGSAFATIVNLDDYRLTSTGAAIGFYDRVELSYAQHAFDTRAIGTALGLGAGYKFKQDIFGVKVKLVGDAIYDQDRWLPQIALGVQHKKSGNGDVLAALGIPHDSGTDVYLTATKLFIDQRLLLNAGVRFTKANQIGILGFGGSLNDKVKPEFEGSLAFLIRRNLAVGVEARTKRDNLGFKEGAAYDAFIAWLPTKNASLTLAYVDLGRIVIPGKQRGLYASLQLSF
jgi:Protein of unknown function (DUF3034)